MNLYSLMFFLRIFPIFSYFFVKFLWGISKEWLKTFCISDRQKDSAGHYDSSELPGMMEEIIWISTAHMKCIDAFLRSKLVIIAMHIETVTQRQLLFLPFQVSIRAANARKSTSREWRWIDTYEKNAAGSCILVHTVTTSCRWNSIYWIIWKRNTVVKI